MFLWLATTALFLIAFYFYVNKQELKQEPHQKKEVKKFIPSDTFSGAKSGYVFKNDIMGIGYYLDSV